MPHIPTVGKPLVNLLEEYIDSCPLKEQKRGERLERSEKARQHRAEVKALQDSKARKE